MGTRKQMQTIYIDASSGLDASLPDGTQVFTKDTAQLWVLNNGSYALMTSGTTSNPEGWTTIVKSADQDITNLQYQNDNDFYFSVVSGGMYMIEGVFAFASTAASSNLGRFAVDSGALSGRGESIASGGLGAIFVNSAATTNNLTVAASSTPSLGFPESWAFKYAFQAQNTTTFRWTYGQNSGTLRLMKGSIMKYKKLN
jgi:hypothetical protein